MGPRTVAVAVSGGVDSSTAAALLLEQGCRPFGLTMILLPCGNDRPPPSLPGREAGGRVEAGENGRSPRGERHLADARAVCARLGIPHHALDLRAEFRREVVEPFIAAYLSGRTPNPCALCNSRLKFGALLDRALALGADALATGHYARLRQGSGGQARGGPGVEIGGEGALHLLRAADPGKDQSYFLFALGQGELSRLLFPLGEMEKRQVRARASALGLPVHDKPESQDACFLPPGGVKEFLRSTAGDFLHPGPIVDTGGKRLGTHAGACLFTVGQRRGLGVASSEPLYVARIEAGKDTVVVGTREEASSPGLSAAGASWVAGRPPAPEFRAEVRIRHRHKPAPASVRAEGEGRFTVRFDETQLGVAPGQAAVVYAGDEVLGGGWIEG